MLTFDKIWYWLLRLLIASFPAVFAVAVDIMPSVVDYSEFSRVIGILKKITDTTNVRI
jgi:hypothetical protein